MSTPQSEKDSRLDQIMIDPDEKEIEQKMIKSILGMPKEVQARFKVLHMLSDKRSKLNDEFNEACKKLEKKILEKKQPLFEQRKQIIDGQLTQFDDFVVKFDESHLQLEKKVASIIKTGDEVPEEEKVPTDVSYLKGKKGVPDFWYRALKQNKMIWDAVKDKDEEIMKSLQHVETITSENSENQNIILTLQMTFDQNNEFFKPNVLKVSLEYENEDQVKQVTGTNIEWFEGKDPTKKKIKKKQKHKKTGETRTVVKTVDADSFFNIFQDRKAPIDGECDSDEEGEKRDKMDEVQQTVEDFHDLLIPDALEYYLGMNEDYDIMGMGEDDFSDDDDNDSDQDEDAPPKKDKKKPSDKKEAGADGQQQECKQQ